MWFEPMYIEISALKQSIQMHTYTPKHTPLKCIEFSGKPHLDWEKWALQVYILHVSSNFDSLR